MKQYAGNRTGAHRLPVMTVVAALLFSAMAHGATTLTISQTLGGTGLGTDNASYVPGGILEISVTIQKAGTGKISALGFDTIVPNGWTYAGLGTGSAPPVTPQNNATGNLGFAWIYESAFPVHFSFRVNIPSFATGCQSLDSYALYRLDAGTISSNHVIPYLTMEGGTAEGECGPPAEGEGAAEGAVEGAVEGAAEGAVEGAAEGAAEGAVEGEGEGEGDPGVCGCPGNKSDFRLENIDQWMGDILLVGLSLGVLLLWRRPQ